MADLVFAIAIPQPSHLLKTALQALIGDETIVAIPRDLWTVILSLSKVQRSSRHRRATSVTYPQPSAEMPSELRTAPLTPQRRHSTFHRPSQRTAPLVPQRRHSDPIRRPLWLQDRSCVSSPVPSPIHSPIDECELLSLPSTTEDEESHKARLFDDKEERRSTDAGKIPKPVGEVGLQGGYNLERTFKWSHSTYLNVRVSHAPSSSCQMGMNHSITSRNISRG
jgi:hypothetical protein